MATRDKPRVLLAVDSLQPGKGGISRVARLIAKVLAEEQEAGALAVRAVTLADRSPPSDIALHVRVCGRSKLAFALAAFRDGFRCTHIIYDAPPLAQMHALPVLRRKPSLAFLHGIEIWERAPVKYLAAARRMTTLLVNSEFTKHKAHQLHGNFDRAQTCWLATEEDAPAPASRPLKERAPNALIVGRLVSDRPKGHAELIACWPEVAAAVPGATLHIVGTGPGRAGLEQLARRSAATDQIFFHGFVSEADLGIHYANARVFAMPSRGEGFGLVYIEAMRHGLPVLGSPHDAASEVILDGQTGMIVDPDNSAGLTAAMIHLLGDSEESAALGDAGRQRWGDHFRYSAFRDRFGLQLRRFLERTE